MPDKIAPERGYMPNAWTPNPPAQADAFNRGLTQMVQQMPPGLEHVVVNPANPGLGANNAANPR